MKKQHYLTLFVIFIGVIINLFLHYYNNQYLHDDIQGQYGIVDYTKSQNDIHYLSHGWQLYKQESNIKDIDKKIPDDIIDIYQSLEVNQAIYRLQIINDKPLSQYSFVLPEIFSQYEFYVNGKLVHQQNDIQYTKLSVPGEQILDCIIVTHNQDHYYSGQVFPIAFGESNAINQMQGIQNYSHAFLIVIGLLSTIIMGCMYIFTGKEKVHLYAFVLSLLFTIYLSHYFIHQFIPVKSIITYLTEDISYFLSLGTLMLFIQQFYTPKDIFNRKTITIIGILIVLSCVIAYKLPYQIHLLYYLSLFFKINILFLLIYTLFKAKEKTLIYYMIIIFVVSYIFDFSYNFEPIYGGWGIEISAILLLIAYNIDVIQRQIHLYKTFIILRNKEDKMLEYTNTKAHDMKAPMASMKGYIELLNSDLNEEDKNYILNKLHEKISLLSNRLTQLQNLDFETCILNKEKTNLKDLLEDIIDEFEIQLMKKEREIIKNIKDIHYNLDSHYFKIIIENLIMNAIEHSYKTKIFVSLYAKNNQVIIEVQDFGEVITEAEMNHLFEQGFSTKGSSRGYGLYISRKIIEEHDGKISVISNEAEGTKFIVQLPKENHSLIS